MGSCSYVSRREGLCETPPRSPLSARNRIVGISEFKYARHPQSRPTLRAAPTMEAHQEKRTVRFYQVMGGQDPQCYDGEFSAPYPNLTALFLEENEPQGIGITIQQGTEPGDMIFASSNVVSERFLTTLQACSATGFRPFPVTVSAGTAKLPYWGLKLLGRGGPFDDKRSNARYGPDGHCLFGYDYIYMDEERWDGSDVFAIPGLGIAMFVTERVKEAIENANLRNVQLTANTDCYLGGPRLRAWWQEQLNELKRSQAGR